ncbi:hypothetical protein ACQJBY_029466 [Aegilops geniculata]
MAASSPLEALAEPYGDQRGLRPPLPKDNFFLVLGILAKPNNNLTPSLSNSSICNLSLFVSPNVLPTIDHLPLHRLLAVAYNLDAALMLLLFLRYLLVPFFSRPIQ